MGVEGHRAGANLPAGQPVGISWELFGSVLKIAMVRERWVKRMFGKIRSSAGRWGLVNALRAFLLDPTSIQIPVELHQV